jgi:DNA-binding NarL/FixJ family response regulator
MTTVATQSPTNARRLAPDRHARPACRRVLCVTDQRLLADGLRARIEPDPSLEWGGVAQSYESVLPMAADSNADLAIIDLNTDSVAAFEFIRTAPAAVPNLRLLAIADPVRDRDIREALDSGVKAFFSKRDDPQTILSGIRAVAVGRTIHNGHTLNGTNANGADAGHTTRLDLLTRRELDILRLFGQGLTRIEIANVLHRSPKTIDCHRASLMKKLEVSDRVELARYAIREGLAEA